MKILHAAKNIAGQSTIISRAQRKLGLKSDVLVFNQNRFEFESDINMNLDRFPGFIRPIVKIVRFPALFFRYDTFHFHYGTSLLPKNMDLGVFASIGRRMGKRTLMHYWGSDVVQLDVFRKHTLIPEKGLKEIFPNADDDKMRRRLKKIASRVDRVIVGDYSLLPYSPGGTVIRKAIDLSKIKFVGAEPKEGKVTIVHAPTNRTAKGTDIIIETIDRLKKEGFGIEFILVENLPNEEALEIYAKADIVVDDVLQGPYGVLATECMAMGKPVLVRIEDELVPFYGDIPVVNSRPDNIYQNLVDLIKNPERRSKLGRAAHEYIRQNHDSDKIAQQLLSLYNELHSQKKRDHRKASTTGGQQ